MPMPAPPSVTVRMERRPILSLSGPIHMLESSCATATRGAQAAEQRAPACSGRWLGFGSCGTHWQKMRA